MRMRGNLSAVEDEWHIRGIAPWVDPVFTFQRTWYPDDTPPSINFNATLAKVFAVLGGGLAGYFVFQKTNNKVYTGLAGAAGFVGAPMLVSAYDYFKEPVEVESAVSVTPWTNHQTPELLPDSNTIVPRPDATLVTGSESPKDIPLTPVTQPLPTTSLTPVLPKAQHSPTGFPAPLVAALGDYLVELYVASNRNLQMLPIFVSGTMLKRASARPMFATVKEALLQMNAELQSFVTRSLEIAFRSENPPPEALRGVTIAGLLRDIQVNAYDTSTAQTQIMRSK